MKQTARKSGFSVVIAVTGYAKVGEQYTFERIDAKSFKLTMVEKVGQEE